MIPHVIASWVVAFALSFAHACLAHSHHATDQTAVAVTAHHQDDSSYPSDCERFCNDDTPLKGNATASDPPAPSFAALPATWQSAAFAPAVAVTDGPHGQAAPLAAHTIPILLRSQRLAL